LFDKLRDTLTLDTQTTSPGRRLLRSLSEPGRRLWHQGCIID